VGGYIGWYTAASFSAGTWTDLSGNGNHGTVSRGSVTVVSTTGNGASATFNVLQGGTGGGILFPVAILPSTFTLFHLTRYNGSQERIYNGTGNNWLNGHWNGSSGVAHHDGWVGGVGNIHGANWVLSASQNSLYRSNKVTRGTAGGGTSTRLGVNDGSALEVSDWQTAECIVYNTHLSSGDYIAVEDYLNSKYGLGL